MTHSCSQFSWLGIGSRRRRAAATLEIIVCLLLFLTLVFGMLDLGMGVFRQHQATSAARFLARKASVHGAMADEMGKWGPGTLIGNAGDGSVVGNILATRMAGGGDLALVSYRVEWIDGSNDMLLDSRVRVVVTIPYSPAAGFLFGGTTFVLSSSVIVPINH
jgi:hypothetical protein